MTNKFGHSIVLFCPDGINYPSIPYLMSYLNCPVVTSLENTVEYSIILFSWTYLWQDTSWITQTSKPIIIGGSAVKFLKNRGELPNYPNVTFHTEDIDFPEYAETRIVPYYDAQIKENPLLDFLNVYSGSGCNWGKCTFCTFPGGKHTQFNPEYVAQTILKANSYGKIAGLSAPTHTVEWLTEMEQYLPPGRRYWCYVRANDNGWSQIQKAESFFIGSEYLSNPVLNRIKKGVTAEKIISSIKEILSSEIDVFSTIIEDLYNNLDELQEHTKNKISLLSYCTPPKLGWGKLRLGSCTLTDDKLYNGYS